MPQTKRRIIVDGVDFGSVVQFPKLLRAVTSSAQPPRIILALFIVVALVAVGRGWDALRAQRIAPGGLLAQPLTDDELALGGQRFLAVLAAYGAEGRSPDVPIELASAAALLEAAYGDWRAALREGGATTPEIAAEDAAYLLVRDEIVGLAPRGTFDAVVGELRSSLHRTMQGVVYLRPQLIYEAARNLFVLTPIALWGQDPTFVVVYGLFFAIVISVGGGALSRMAACDFAGQERLRVRDAVDFALGNWLKLVLTLVLPGAIAAGVALVLIGLGLLFAPWLDVLGGALYGLSLVLGFVLVFMLIGYAAGGPLLLPAVACENCDAADAQQRAYAYVLNRPLHLVGYAIVAVVGLVLGFVVIGGAATLVLNATATLTGLASSNSALLEAGGFSLGDLGPTRPGAVHSTWHSGVAATAISFWQRLVIDIVAAYVVAYIFTSATIVYLLMRRACDGQDVEEIWRPGLAPGTLVPLPGTRVEAAEQD